MSFSERLKYLRKAKKIEQKELALTFGITTRSWRFYEAGQREPPLRLLIKIADYFNVSIDFLVGRSDNPKWYSKL